MAGFLVNPEPRPREQFLLNARQRAQLFTASALLHVRYLQPKEMRLSTLVQFVSNRRTSLRDKLIEMSRGLHDADGRRNWTTPCGKPTRTHPFVEIAAQLELGAPEGLPSLETVVTCMLLRTASTFGLADQLAARRSQLAPTL